MSNFLNFVGGMAGKVNEIKAEERKQKRDLELLERDAFFKSKYSTTKANPFSISWEYTDKNGNTQIATLEDINGNPTDAGVYKDDKDRTAAQYNFMDQLADLPIEAQNALINAKEGDAAFDAHNKFAGVHSAYGNLTVRQKYNPATGSMYAPGLGNLRMSNNSDFDRVFNQRVYKNNLDYNSLGTLTKEAIIERSGLDLSMMDNNNQMFVESMAGALTNINKQNPTAMPIEVSDRITDALMSGEEAGLNDPIKLATLISSTVNGNRLQLKNNTFTQRVNLQEELRLSRDVDKMLVANEGAIRSVFSLLSSFKNLGLRGQGTWDWQLFLQGLSDTKNDFVTLFNKNNVAGVNESSFRRVAEEDLGIEQFDTGATDKDGTTIMDKEYDGMTLTQAMNHDFNAEIKKNDKVAQIARIRAIQIHLAFQVAIASQGYQGGKAVSDADFERAWQKIGGNTNRGFFTSMLGQSGGEQFEASLKRVISEMGEGLTYNYGYKHAMEGTKKQTAQLNKSVLRNYWNKNVKGKGEGLLHEDFGFWAATRVYMKDDIPTNIDGLLNDLTGIYTANRNAQGWQERDERVLNMYGIEDEGDF